MSSNNAALDNVNVEGAFIQISGDGNIVDARVFKQYIIQQEKTPSSPKILAAKSLPHINKKELDLDEDNIAGGGATANVYIIQFVGQTVAVKIYHHIIVKDRTIQQEIRSLSFLRHSNIVPVYALVVTKPPSNKSSTAAASSSSPTSPNSPSSSNEPVVCGYVMEKMSGSLQEIIKDAASFSTISPKEKLTWLCQIAAGLAYAHSQHIIHADIKPDNILVSETIPRVCKISDFGSAYMISTSAVSASLSSSSHSVKGTAGFIAPELLAAKTKPNEKTDVFSFGMLVWCLFHPGIDRGLGNTAQQIDFAIGNGRRPQISSSSGNISSEIQKLIVECWDQRADIRLTMKIVLAKLQRCAEIASSSSSENVSPSLNVNNNNVATTASSSSAVWQKDEAVSECMKCVKKFGLFTRKHHCRYDGLIYCSDCSDYSLPRSLVPNPALPSGATTSDNNSQKFKVCVDCYSKVMAVVDAEKLKKQLLVSKWSSRKQEQPANDGFIKELVLSCDSTISKSAIENVLKYLTVATTEFWTLTLSDISYMICEENDVDQADKIFNVQQYLMNEEHWNELKIPVDAKSVECFLSKEFPGVAQLDSYRTREFVSQLVKILPKRSETVAVHSLIFRNFGFLSNEGKKLLGKQEVVDSLVDSCRFISSANAVECWSSAISNIVFNNESNIKLFGCSSIRDSLVAVSKFSTTAEAVRWFSSAILNIVADNESNKKLFGCSSIRDCFVSVSKYATTSDAISYWSTAINNIAIIESNQKLFGCSSIVDSFVLVNKYATTAVAVRRWSTAINTITQLESNKQLFGCQHVVDALVDVSKYATTSEAVRCWSSAINNIVCNNEFNNIADLEWWSSAVSNIAIIECNRKLFACSAIVDSFVAVSKYATSDEVDCAVAVRCWVGAINNITNSDDVDINRVFNSCSEFKQVFFSLKQNLEQMPRDEDEDTIQAKEFFGAAEKRLFPCHHEFIFFGDSKNKNNNNLTRNRI